MAAIDEELVGSSCLGFQNRLITSSCDMRPLSGLLARMEVAWINA